MGFWDKAFNVAKDVGTNVAAKIEESANEIREIAQKFEEKDDDELLRVIHSDGFFGSGAKEKGVASKILRQRGYTVDQINAAK